MTRALAAIVCALCAALACQKQASGPASPPASEQPQAQEHRRLTDVDALEHDLEVAERRLDQEVRAKLTSLDRSDSPDQEKEDFGGSTRGGEAGPPPPAEPKPPDSGGADDEAERRWQQAEVGSPCDQACRALSSMKRSADAICRISGDPSPRCDRARSRVAGAEKRVKNAGCVCRAR